MDEDVAHGLAGIRRLVQTLQDQVDSSSTAPADDTSLSARKPSSHAQAFVLESFERMGREAVAAKAAWAVANLVANNKESQDAVR